MIELYLWRSTGLAMSFGSIFRLAHWWTVVESVMTMMFVHCWGSSFIFLCIPPARWIVLFCFSMRCKDFIVDWVLNLKVDVKVVWQCSRCLMLLCKLGWSLLHVPCIRSMWLRFPLWFFSKSLVGEFVIFDNDGLQLQLCLKMCLLFHVYRVSSLELAGVQELLLVWWSRDQFWSHYEKWMSCLRCNRSCLKCRSDCLKSNERCLSSSWWRRSRLSWSNSWVERVK